MGHHGRRPSGRRRRRTPRTSAFGAGDLLRPRRQSPAGTGPLGRRIQLLGSDHPRLPLRLAAHPLPGHQVPTAARLGRTGAHPRPRRRRLQRLVRRSPRTRHGPHRIGVEPHRLRRAHHRVQTPPARLRSGLRSLPVPVRARPHPARSPAGRHPGSRECTPPPGTSVQRLDGHPRPAHRPLLAHRLPPAPPNVRDRRLHARVPHSAASPPPR